MAEQVEFTILKEAFKYGRIDLYKEVKNLKFDMSRTNLVLSGMSKFTRIREFLLGTNYITIFVLHKLNSEVILPIRNRLTNSHPSS
jgi:hypothetical protein